MRILFRLLGAPVLRRTRLVVAALSFMLLGLSAGPAFAHAFLVRAVPAVGARVAAPPRLLLFYTEGLVPHFCRVQLRGPGGAAVAIGRPELAPGHKRELRMRLPHLAPGHYTVRWHAVSTDAHRTKGAFSFTVTGRTP